MLCKLPGKIKNGLTLPGVWKVIVLPDRLLAEKKYEEV
jgi:hypothetical protein